MNNLLRRTLALRADKNFGHSDLLLKIPVENCEQQGTSLGTDPSFQHDVLKMLPRLAFGLRANPC
jgi:hypothetical protein